MTVCMATETFAEYLRDLLRRKGIKQTQLAAYVEASPPAVVDWLSGKRMPGPGFLWRLARYDRTRSFEDLMAMAGHIPEEARAEPLAPEIIPEIREALDGMTPDEQRDLAEVIHLWLRHERRRRGDTPQ